MTTRLTLHGWSTLLTWMRRAGRREEGMTTAEYAVGTMAAVGFALVLLAVVRSDAVRSTLTSIITSALNSAD